MFQVYHNRDRQFGVVFKGGYEDDREYVRWSCGFIQIYRKTRLIKVVGN